MRSRQLILSGLTLFMLGCGQGAIDGASDPLPSPAADGGEHEPAAGHTANPFDAAITDVDAAASAAGGGAILDPETGHDAGPDATPDATTDEADAGVTDPDAGTDAGPTPYVPDPVTMGESLPSRVPVIRIDVSGQTIQKDVNIPGQIEIFETHDGTLSDLETATPTLTAAIAFQGRGNFTWSLPKKGYAFELQDGAGNDKDFSILGLPKGSDFALYACYTDKTCMRNALVYAFGQELGKWSPRTRFVELIIDGQYQGLYMVWERIRGDATRCEVGKPAKTASTGDLTGSYLFRVEGGKGTETSGGMTYARDFSVSSGREYTYHYPDADKITTEQATYLKGFLQSFEDAMQSDGSQYPTWIDVASWVDRGIVEELTNNWDGYVHSVYVIKTPESQGNKLVMGPLWDFDLAFANGNVTGYNCHTDYWAHDIVRGAPDDVAPYWLQLFDDEAFQHAFKCRWQALREGPLALATFDARMAAWKTFTAEARVRDQAKWNTIGKSIFPNCFSKPSYDEEVNALHDWIDARLTWIDGQVATWPGECP